MWAEPTQHGRQPLVVSEQARLGSAPHHWSVEGTKRAALSCGQPPTRVVRASLGLQRAQPAEAPLAEPPDETSEAPGRARAGKHRSETTACEIVARDAPAEARPDRSADIVNPIAAVDCVKSQPAPPAKKQNVAKESLIPPWLEIRKKEVAEKAKQIAKAAAEAVARKKVEEEATRRASEEESRKLAMQKAQLAAKAAADEVARRRAEEEAQAKAREVQLRATQQKAKLSEQREESAGRRKSKAEKPKLPHDEGSEETRAPQAKPACEADEARDAPADGIAADQAEKRAEPDGRPHLHVVLLGHEGAGKSTLFGAMHHAVGTWDARALGKYKKQLSSGAPEVQRSECLATSEARLTLLDVPGSPKCVPEAGRALAEADVVLLVVSAKGKDFEKALEERFGPLREHALLARGLGARAIVIAVNKMGEVDWKEERFGQIRSALTSFLGSVGFDEQAMRFTPVDGLAGDLGVGGKAQWHAGGHLLGNLTSLATEHSSDGSAQLARPLRILVLECVKEQAGTITIEGRVESGRAVPGMACLVSPKLAKCTVDAVLVAGRSVSHACAGEALTLRLTGISDVAEVAGGSVIAEQDHSVRASSRFKAEIDVLDLPQDRPLLSAGFTAVMHIHLVTIDCEIVKIHEATTLATGEVEQKPKAVRVGQRAVVVFQLTKEVAVDEFAEGRGRLGMIALRTDGRTVAVGKVVELPQV